jgi:enoyl-CoA hydratase/carnithine racemase
VPAERLDQEIGRLAEAIAAKPPSVIAAGKALFYRQLQADIGTAYRLAGEAMASNMADKIAQEGVAAFIEKRSPNWRPD